MDTATQRSFLLNTTDQVWMVHDGAGARRHLHRVMMGDVLFGLGRPEGGDEPCLLAVPTADAELYPLPPDNSALRENFADWLDGWIAGLCAGLSPQRPPKSALLLAAGKALTLPAGGQAFAPGEVLWVEPAADTLRWQGEALPAGSFPLAPFRWLEATGATTLPGRWLEGQRHPGVGGVELVGAHHPRPAGRVVQVDPPRGEPLHLAAAYGRAGLYPA